MNGSDQERLRSLEIKVGELYANNSNLYQRCKALEDKCESLHEIVRVGRFRFRLASFCGWVAEKLRENARRAKSE